MQTALVNVINAFFGLMNVILCFGLMNIIIFYGLMNVIICFVKLLFIPYIFSKTYHIYLKIITLSKFIKYSKRVDLIATYYSQHLNSFVSVYISSVCFQQLYSNQLPHI